MVWTLVSRRLMLLTKLGFIILFIGAMMIRMSAQDEVTKESVYLRDGSVLKGQIIEDNDFFIRIIIETGDTLKIGYRNIIPEQNRSYVPVVLKERTYLEEGYFFTLGVLSMFEDSGGEFQFLLGKRFNSKLNLGMQVAYSVRDDVVGVNWIQPKLLNTGIYGRYYVTGQRPRFFIDGSVGYAFAINDGNNFDFFRSTLKGGLQANGSMGLHFAGRKASRWLLNWGVKYNDTSGTVEIIDGPTGNVFTEYTKKYISLYMGIHIEF